MVSFTCDKCQDCIKKKRIQAHNRCRSSYSCVDCQKTFTSEQTKAHTECISEAEKYNGKFFKPKQKNTQQKDSVDKKLSPVKPCTPNPSDQSKDETLSAKKRKKKRKNSSSAVPDISTESKPAVDLKIVPENSKSRPSEKQIVIESVSKMETSGDADLSKRSSKKKRKRNSSKGVLKTQSGQAIDSSHPVSDQKEELNTSTPSKKKRKRSKGLQENGESTTSSSKKGKSFQQNMQISAGKRTLAIRNGETTDVDEVSTKASSGSQKESEEVKSASGEIVDSRKNKKKKRKRNKHKSTPTKPEIVEKDAGTDTTGDESSDFEDSLEKTGTEQLEQLLSEPLRSPETGLDNIPSGEHKIPSIKAILISTLQENPNGMSLKKLQRYYVKRVAGKQVDAARKKEVKKDFFVVIASMADQLHVRSNF